MLLSITFFAALGLTVLGVLLTARAGRRGERRSHVIRALVTVALLAVTVLLALWLGQQREFPEDAMATHKIYARTAGLLVLPVALTGIVLWTRPSWRIVHRVCVYVLIVMLVVAIATGVWAFSLSTPTG